MDKTPHWKVHNPYTTIKGNFDECVLVKCSLLPGILQ